MYLAQKAAGVRKPSSGTWRVDLVGAIATISRTVVVMGIAMLILGVWLRRRSCRRCAGAARHPDRGARRCTSALGGLAHSFGIGGGPLIESVQGRPARRALVGWTTSSGPEDVVPVTLVGLGIDSSQVKTSGVPAARRSLARRPGPRSSSTTSI